MAILADEQRFEVWAQFMSDLSNGRESIGDLTKQDLRAAFNAVDDWVDANAASLNSAIPQPARGVLTAPQKARLLMLVVQKRFGAGV